MPVNSKETFEEIVKAIGNQHRQPFSRKTGNIISQIMLELIHSDIFGPMNVDSEEGSRFFESFIDDYSWFITVYMIKDKSDAFTKF